MSWKQKCTHRSGGCYQFQHVLYQACYLQMCKDLLADNRVDWSCRLTWAHYSSVSYWLVNAFYFSTPNALFWFLLPECPSELSRSYLDTLVEGDSMAWQEGNLQVCSSLHCMPPLWYHTLLGEKLSFCLVFIIRSGLRRTWKLTFIHLKINNQYSFFIYFNI